MAAVVSCLLTDACNPSAGFNITNFSNTTMQIGITNSELPPDPAFGLHGVVPSVFESHEERGIVIVGAGHIGKNDIANEVARLAEKDIKVLIVGDNNHDFMNTFEIDGIRYREKEKSPKRYSKSLSRLMLMAAAFSSLDPYAPKPKNFETPNVDIISEYELIQKKQSKLTKSKRDWVVFQFERNFERVS